MLKARSGENCDPDELLQNSESGQIQKSLAGAGKGAGKNLEDRNLLK